MTIFLALFNKYFPLIIKHLRADHYNKPYITPEIKQMIREKNILARRCAEKPITFGGEYRRVRNQVTQTIRNAKGNYYKRKLEEGAGNSKKVWKVINSVLGKHKNKQLNDNFIHNNNEINDPQIIADQFNSYFINVGKNLAENIEDSNISFNSYLHNRQESTFTMSPITSDELISTVNNLRDSSPGCDGVPMNILRSVVPLLSPVLLHLCNKSFSTGVFPDQLKIAKVLPIHKSGDKRLFNNHRPISVLPAISKILEKLMYNRISEFCTTNNIISQAQYGFRQGRSTETALTKFKNDVLKAFDNRSYTISLFLDMSKAFDTVDHQILLEKLKHYGIRDTAYHWFKSYLDNRKQYVEYGGTNSTTQTVSFGVPQGSILGPLLFILYVNDITSSSRLFDAILFADDTTLYASHSNLDTLIEMVNNELNNVHGWITANKLTLNINKTKYLIHQRNKNVPRNTDPINIGNTIVTEEENTTFLGVVVDRQLTWNSHIQSVSSKISKQCGILYLTRNCFNKNALKQLYYSLVYPFLSYCHTVWGSAGKTKLKRIELAQKKSIRTISFKSKYDHTNELFKSLYLLKWEDINNFCSAIFVYKSIHNYNGMPLFNFRLNERYNLRNSNDLEIPRMITKQSQTSINYHGVKVWNSLPHYIQNKPSLSSFKISLKSYLFSKY